MTVTLRILAIAAALVATLTPAKAEDLTSYYQGLATIWTYDKFCKPAHGLTPEGVNAIIRNLGLEGPAALSVVEKDFFTLGQEKFCAGMATGSVERVIGQINAIAKERN
jgi:hypothetical protein